MSDATPQPRGKPASVGAWCWQEKAALRLIAKHFGEGKKQATARSVYLALTQIASDEQSERFQKPVAYIAMVAGIAARTLQQEDMLPRLQKLRLIRIEKRFENGGQIASFYTILKTEAPAQEIHHPPAKSAPPWCKTETKQTAGLLNNGSEESLGKLSVREFENEAAQIYEAYPRKGNKDAALKHIIDALGQVGFDELLRRTKKYAKFRKGENPRFTPFPDKWFGEERFKDAHLANYSGSNSRTVGIGRAGERSQGAPDHEPIVAEIAKKHFDEFRKEF